jgi:hypothetical protein
MRNSIFQVQILTYAFFLMIYRFIPKDRTTIAYKILVIVLVVESLIYVQLNI